MAKSTDDSRVGNNTLRHEYRTLSDEEKALIDTLKANGDVFLRSLSDAPQGREAAIARTKIEEAVMWAVRAVTA